MGWERRGARSYYYAKERTPEGRVRSIYLGSGMPAQEAASAAEDLRRMERVLLRAGCEAFPAVDRALAVLLDAERALRLWRDGYLAATGHRPHRGQWRRRRTGGRFGPRLSPFLPWHAPPDSTHTARDGLPIMPTKPTKPERTEAPLYEMTPGTRMDVGTGTAFTVPAGMEAERKALEVALDNLRGGDWIDASAVRDALAAFPSECFGPFSGGLTRRALAGFVTGVDTNEPPVYHTAFAVALAEAEMQRHAADLAQPGDGPLVLAACEQAANARVVLDKVTRGYVSALSGTYFNNAAAGWEKRLSAAQTRHLRALATVAALRRAEREEMRAADRHERTRGRTARPARDRRGLYSSATPEAAEGGPLALPAHAGDSVPRPEDVDVCAT